MKLPTILLALIVAAGAFALSPDRAEWGNGPVQFLMTKEEIAQWKAIKDDAAADAFVALFWARRDPTPATPRNELREQFEQRVAAADTSFKSDRKRGALTDRGKALILYGQPRKMERTGEQRGSSQPQGIINSDDPTKNAMRDNTETHVWTYDDEVAKSVFGVPRAVLRFTDRFGNSEFKLERGSVDFAKAQQRAIEKMIVQPNLTEVPRFDTPPQEAAVEAPAPAPVQTELTTDALKAAVAAAKKATGASKVFATTGEFVTSEGETFVPVLVYLPKSAGFAAEGNTFFGVVEDASGNPVLAFEEPAKLIASKDDWFVDKSLTLPPGKFRGYFGVSGNGKTEVAAVDMELAGKLDKDATAASSLIISNNVYPLSEAQRATDPFAFGGLKVVPKADRAFRTTDELWYFVELRNPGLPESIPVATVDGTTPPPPAPKIQVKLEVVSKDASGKEVKRSAPPMEVEAIPLKGVPNHYGVGSSIPLSGFKPGDYTFNVKIIDTVSKSSYSMSEKFKVVE
jgi:GWxTD domain-containing protein